MSILSIVQSAAQQIGLPTPTVVITATDQTTITMGALLQEVGRSLSSRYQWNALVKEATFITLAAELQGAMTSLAGSDFNYMLGETIWIRDLIQPVGGGMSAQTWQMMKSNNITGPYPRFRIRQGSLYMLPIPAAGQTGAFEYVSKNWCADLTGVTGKQAFTADTDIGLLDENLLTLGLKWMFLRAKDFDYAEEFDEYESRVSDAIVREGTPPPLFLARRRAGFPFCGPRPSDGSWTIP